MLRQLSRRISEQELADNAKPAIISQRWLASERAAHVIRANALPARAFDAGVLNLVLASWLFGAYPEHYWVLYLLEFPVLTFIVALQWWKSNRLLYFCEFCWVINATGWLYLVLELLPFLGSGGAHALSAPVRLGLAQALFATANGPLALSVLALSNALVFHDVERWGGVIIHFGPALVSWSLTWKSAAVQAAWPGAFGALANQAAACAALRAGAKRTACEQENAAAIAAANAPLALYFTWWLVYGAWLLYFGCTLPERRGCRSSFGDMRPICAKLLAPFGVGRAAVRAHAALYLAIHGALVSAALSLLPSLLRRSWALHGAFLVLLLLFVVRQGGGYYRHAFGEKLVRAVGKNLTEAGPPETARDAQTAPVKSVAV